jgi:hypothetical protein
MKSNGITTILNVILAFCLLTAMILCFQFVVLARDVRANSIKVPAINGWRSSVQAFAADCVEYSRKNPELIPILETAGLAGTKPAAPAKSATK